MGAPLLLLERGNGPSAAAEKLSEKGDPNRPPVEVRLDGWLDGIDGAPVDEPPAAHARLLLSRYERLGETFLDRVEGRFALTLLDRERGLAIAARDGLGHFGLDYVLSDARFAVARDGADLLALPGVGAELDPLRLAEFFSSEELSGPHTFFRDVRSVLPGEVLIVDGRSVRRRALRRPTLNAKLDVSGFEPLVELFAERFAAAVERCVRGAGPIAVLGGGGLDSSPIAAFAARLAGSPPPILSWRVSDSESDERRFGEALAARLDTKIHWIEGDDARPFADPASWPVHPSTPEQTAFRILHQRSYERAAELGARTLLTGFGGDSLYTHGRRWFFGLLASEGVGAAIDQLRKVARKIGWTSTLRSQVAAPLLWRTRGFRRRPPAWLTAEARERLASRSPWPARVEGARRPRQAERLLALVDGHGEQVERFYTEPFGIEQRTPLRDLDLVELALSLPDHLLGRGTETRTVLRASMRGVLPEPVRTRSGKASFRPLLMRGLEPGRTAWMRPLLEREGALWRGFVEPAAVARWLDGRFASEGEIVGLLNCVYAELWRDRRPAAG